MAIDYKNELNGSQCDAVLYTEGNSMVIAGAGSGKTRVLTYRIAHLLEEGYEPWSILALTFTNKAAGEMKQRISDKVGGNRAKYLWMGTFHSIFSRILRNEADHLGYSHDFTIYDQTDSQNLIKTIIREMQLDEKTYKPSAVQGRISTAKNGLLSASAYQNNSECMTQDRSRNMQMVGRIYQKYEERCRLANAMDFDDLLLQTFYLFRDNKDVLEKYSSQFRQIMVDEYQDTNYAQHCIVWQLSRGGAKVCVVGDDAQSIYSFRGANIDNMLKFTKLYPDAKVFKLEQNYRSTQTIVSAAGSLIDKNSRQIKKNVFSENEKGDSIKVLRAHSDIEESEIVVNKMTDLHTFDNVAWKGMAVLYRTNAQSRTLEEALRKRGLPYKIYGGLSFYSRKEIKDVISYLRLAINPNDEEAFKRTINYPARGIGQTTVGKLLDAAATSGQSLWTIASDPSGYGVEINSGTAAKIAGYVSLIQSFRDKVQQADAYHMVQAVIKDSGIDRDLASDHSVEGEGRRDNVQELLTGIKSFCDQKIEEGDEHIFLPDYLSEVSLMTDQDREGDEDIEKVTLMTVHAAKGLEFNTVFIVGLEEDLFPSTMSGESEKQIEEERRLFYVAMTRAEQRLFLLYAMQRFKYGNYEAGVPSRFLKDIDPQYLDAPAPAQRMTFRGTGFNASPYMRRNSEDGVPQFQRRSESAAPQFRQKQGYTSSSGTKQAYNPAAGSQKPAYPGRGNRSSLQVVTEDMLRNTAPKSAAGALHEGNVIEHERFGIGSVLSVEGQGSDMKAKIKFLTFGEKTLLLKFAKYKVLK